MIKSLISKPLVLAAVLLPSLWATAAPVIPFNKATVTRLENNVSFGELKDGKSKKRRAAVSDVILANNFLLTETESRAELQYEDGSVVRVGQNTVFSFDASSRTLALEKGAFIFFVPKGSGGGTIKTPSLTAAITGTVGKVSRDRIIILEGEVTLVPSGIKVAAGFFAVRNPDGTISVKPFDLARATEGRLMTFNGPMPGFYEGRLRLRPDPRVLDAIDAVQTANSSPAALRKFDPPPQPPRMQDPVVVPPPRPVEPQTPRD